MPSNIAPASKKEVSAGAVAPDENTLFDRMSLISIRDDQADVHGPASDLSNNKDANVFCDNDLDATAIPANSNILAAKKGRQPMMLAPQSQKIYSGNDKPVSKKGSLASKKGALTSKRGRQPMALRDQNPDIYSNNGTEEKDFALCINKHRVSFTPEGSPSKVDHTRNISDLSTTETLVGNDNEASENEDDLATPTKHTVRITSLQAKLASLTAQLHDSKKANIASRNEITTLKAASRRQRLEICNLNRSLNDIHQQKPSSAPRHRLRATHANEISSLNATHANELAGLKAAYTSKLAALEARAAKSEALAIRVHELGEQQYQRAERLQAAGQAEWARANAWQAKHDALAATADTALPGVSSPAATRVVDNVVGRIDARLGDIMAEVRRDGAAGQGLPAQEKAVMEPLEGVFETDAEGEAKRGEELEGMFEFLAKRGAKMREMGMDATEEEVMDAMRCDEERTWMGRMQDDVFAAVRRDNENMRRMRAARR